MASRLLAEPARVGGPAAALSVVGYCAAIHSAVGFQKCGFTPLVWGTSKTGDELDRGVPTDLVWPSSVCC